MQAKFFYFFKIYFSLIVVWGILQLPACGGSSGGDVPRSLPYPGISVSASNLTFTATRNGELPSPQTVSVTYRGETIGFSLLDSESFSWLDHNPNPTGTDANTFPVEIGIFTTDLDPGTHEGVIRYEAGANNRTVLASRDIRITYTVAPNGKEELPSTPGNFTAQGMQRSVLLQWYVPSTVDFSIQNYYKLYIAPQADLPLSNYDVVNVYDDRYIHLDLAPDRTFYYRLSLVQNGVESDPTDVAQATTLESTTTPGRPIDFGVYEDSQSSLIKWRGAVNADGYNLYWSTRNFSNKDNATLIADVTSPYVHATESDAPFHFYKLIPYNQFGEGTATPTLQVTWDGSWIRQFHTDVYDVGETVEVDVNNNIYVLGHSSGHLQSNTGDAPQHFEFTPAFIAKYNLAGDQLWLMQVDQPEEQDIFTDLAVDTDGNTYLTGYARYFDSETRSGRNDLLIAKFDTGGELVWRRRLAIGADPKGLSIALDASKNIFIASEEDPSGNRDIVLRKFNATAETVLWAKTLATDEDDYEPEIVVDDTGNCYIINDTQGDMFNDGVALQGRNVVFTKFSPSGESVFSKLIHEPGLSLQSQAITTDGNAYIYIIGTIYGSMLSGRPATNNYEYLMKFNLDGDKLWEQTVVFTEAKDVDVAPDGSIHIAGSTQSINFEEMSNILWRKYDADGNELDERQYITNRIEEARGVVIDNNNHAYLTGRTDGDLQGVGKIPTFDDLDGFLIRVGEL